MRTGLVIAASLLMVGAEAAAQHRHSFQYPLVYGPTGHPDGPTQAHYQYQRQYGRPWHGYGGLSAPSYSGSHVTLSGAYYPTWGGWGGGGYWSPYIAPPAVGLGFYSPGYYGNFGVIY